LDANLIKPKLKELVEEWQEDANYASKQFERERSYNKTNDGDVALERYATESQIYGAVANQLRKVLSSI
jgi:rRNA-processing protein FCF1